MSTALAPPDAEAALVAYLPAPAGTRLPNPVPAAFTRVTRAGGDQRNLIQADTRLLIECWAGADGVPDETTAFNRAQMAWAKLWAAKNTYLAAGVFVTRVQLTDPVNFPDTSPGGRGLARYQFVAQLTLGLISVETA